MTNDRVFVENLRLRCRVGITERERRQEQEVVVDMSFFMDLKRAGRTDDLQKTVDYRKAMREISDFASGREFGLLESLAQGLASLALKHAGVERAIVKVRKAKYLDEPSAGIEIERVRTEG